MNKFLVATKSSAKIMFSLQGYSFTIISLSLPKPLSVSKSHQQSFRIFFKIRSNFVNFEGRKC